MKTDSKQAFGVRYLKSALRLFASTSIQGAVCITVGGIVALIALAAGASEVRVPMWFMGGTTLPLWPLKLYYAPERIFVRRASKLDWLHRKGLLTKTRCAAEKKEVKEWALKEMKAHDARQIPSQRNYSDDSEQEEDE